MKKKSIELILDEALENLLLINQPVQARKAGLTKLNKFDFSDMHWLHVCAVVKIFKDSTQASERKLGTIFGISKTEIHRMLILSNIPSSVRKKAFENDVDKWVLVKMTQQDLSHGAYVHLVEGVLSGRLTKYSQVRDLK